MKIILLRISDYMEIKVAEVRRHHGEDAREVRVAGAEVRVLLADAVGEHHLDRVKPRVNQEEAAGRARVPDGLHRVHLAEVLAEADVAGLREERGRAVFW